MINERNLQAISQIDPLQVRIELFKKGDFNFIVEGIAKNGEGIGSLAVHEKQRQALEVLRSNKYDLFLYGGAAGGAKSWTGVSWITFMCLAFPGTRWFIARNELKDLTDSVMVTFAKVCREYGITDYKFNAVKNYIEFPNGSHINLIEVKYKPSDPMYEDVGSTEYTGGWFEEIGEINKKAVSVLGTRVGRHMNDEYGIEGIIFLTCNPKKNWAKNDFYDKHVNGSLLIENEDKSKLKKFYLNCLVTENPFIEQKYIDNLRKQASEDKSMYERLFKGNWDYEENENALCDYEMIEQVFDNDHVVQGQTFLTADIARYGSDKAVIGVWRGWRLIEIVTYAISKTTQIENTIRLLRRKYQIPKNRCIADQDGVGCLTVNTEVLTTKGWKKAVEITLKDTLVSKDENNNREFVKPYEVIHHDREKFIKINNDLALTVGHIHFYKTRKDYKFKTGYWDDITELDRFYNDTEINPIEPSDNHIVFDSTHHELPNGGIKDFNNRLSIPLDVFSEFLGWYLSEGSTDDYNNKHVIQVTQSSKSPHNQEIEHIFNLMGVKWRKSIHKNGTLFHYRFQHKAMFNWLRETCYVGDRYNCYNKRLPHYLKNTSKDVFMSFCQAFIKGDGYYHKGMMQFVSTSKKMLDDIQEGLFMNSIRSRIYIKHKKGSKGNIFGREITRTTDCYVLSEIKHVSTYRVLETGTYFDKAINIRIPNKTKAMLIRNGKEIFWTHNGGVVDGTGIKGFTNNARALVEKGKKDQPNYKNIQVQCLYHLADKVNEGGLWIMADLSSNEKEEIKAELDQIQSKNNDERKLDCKSKSEIKQDIGRSPDWRDMLLMRVYFDLKGTKPKFMGSRPRNTI